MKMTKHYAFLLTLLMGLLGLDAAAVTTTITLAPGSSAQVETFSGSVLATLKEGANPIEQEAGASLFIRPTNGHSIVSFKNANGVDVVGNSLYADQRAEIGYYHTTRTSTYTLETLPTSELPRIPFTVTVDNPSIVNFSMANPGGKPTLVAGTNQLSYTPTYTRTVSISSSGDRNLYQVKLNGVVQTAKWGSYTISLSEGCEIEILANHPDEDLTYNFVYEDEADFWTAVVVDGVRTGVTNNTLSVKAGSNVELYCTNADEWYIKKITLPDGQVFQGGYLGGGNYLMNGEYPLVFTAKASGEVYVDAHKIKTFNVNLNLKGADCVNIYQGLENQPQYLLSNLKEGLNAIQIVETTSRVGITVKDEDCIIDAVTLREKAGADLVEVAYNSGTDSYTIVQGRIGEGAEINVTAHRKAPDVNMTLNVTDPADLLVYTCYPVAGLTKTTPYNGTLQGGDNTVAYAETYSGLFFLPAHEDCSILSVTYRTSADSQEIINAAFDEATGCYFVLDPKEGWVINVVTDHNERDSDCYIYLDNAEASLTPVTANSPAGRQIPLYTGYNHIRFDMEENEGYYGDGFIIRMGSSSGNFSVYADNEPVEINRNAYGTTATVVLTQDAVVKVYVATASPSTVPVKFYTYNEASAVNCVTDFTKTFDPADDLRVLPGTMVAFDVACDREGEITVELNRTPVEPVSPNHYELCVTQGANISIQGPEEKTEPEPVEPDPDGIETITAEAAAASSAVFHDLSGRRVNAPSQGLYIRILNGKASKVIVK